MADVSRIPIGLRVPPDALDAIDARAAERRLTRTEYMIRAALGEDDGADLGLTARMDALEHRLERLEEIAFER